MMVSQCGEGPDPNAMRKSIGPGMIDTQVRQAIHLCWTMMPEERKTVEHVEAEIRRLVERALKDLREDAQAFGIGRPE